MNIQISLKGEGNLIIRWPTDNIETKCIQKCPQNEQLFNGKIKVYQLAIPEINTLKVMSIIKFYVNLPAFAFLSVNITKIIRHI